MDNISFLISFFGWCSLLNIGMLLLATLLLTSFRKSTKKIHSKLFNIPEVELNILYFKYLAYYKICFKLAIIIAVCFKVEEVKNKNKIHVSL